MNRYNLALLLLALTAVPLFYVSGWLGVAAALIAIYVLLARLAIRNLERPSGRTRSVRLGGRGADSQHPAGVRPIEQLRADIDVLAMHGG